jgi:hypothetical protein
MYTQIKTSEGTFVCKTDNLEQAKEHLGYYNFEITGTTPNYSPSEKAKEYLEKKVRPWDFYDEDRDKLQS